MRFLGTLVVLLTAASVHPTHEAAENPDFSILVYGVTIINGRMHDGER
jgi:hypothetical protein